MHEQHHEGVWAGLTRFTKAGDEVVKWTLEERENALVLEGAATIEIEGGPTIEVKGGRPLLNPQGRQHDVAPDQAVQGILGAGITRLRVRGAVPDPLADEPD
jgi:quercetin dioxygenase-like cupin family protein